MPLSAADFDYSLPQELIAQHPLGQRDQSRLMVLRRKDRATEHRIFADLPELLQGNDLLVLNDTRVLPARLACRRKSGARIEGLFLCEPARGRWQMMLKNAGRCKVGEALVLEGTEGLQLTLCEKLQQGQWLAKVNSDSAAVEILDRCGLTPLPPYIRREARTADDADRLGYQTVYASRAGAVAAPTAGLHFTWPLMESLSRRGVEMVYVTLHVGVGTFAPVKVQDLPRHRMHAEWYELPSQAAEKLNAARSQQRRIVAVGTTSARVLETVAARGLPLGPASGWTDIFIYPPAHFRAVDALITNFHLPRSTLLMLVAAFCDPGGCGGVKVILDAYAEAARLRYRFYSYGDAMLIE